MTRPFSRTLDRKFTPRRYGVPGATINGRPAWQVAQERKAQPVQSNPSAQFEREQERPLNLWLIIAMPLIAALFLATVSLLSGGRSVHETGLCSEACR